MGKNMVHSREYNSPLVVFSLLVLFSFAATVKEKRKGRALGSGEAEGPQSVPSVFTRNKYNKPKNRKAPAFLHAFLVPKKRRCRVLFRFITDNFSVSHKKKTKRL